MEAQRIISSAISYIHMSSLKSLSFLLSVVERRDGDNVPVRVRFKSGHVRSRPLDWTKELQCAKFGVNAALATAKAPYTNQGRFSQAKSRRWRSRAENRYNSLRLSKIKIYILN